MLAQNMNIFSQIFIVQNKNEEKKEIREKISEAQISSGWVKWSRICKDIKIEMRKCR